MEEASKQNRQLRAPSEDYGGMEEPPSSYDGYVRMGIHICTPVNGTRHYYGSFGQRIIRSAMPQRIKLTREVSRKNGMPIRLSVSTTVFITNFIYRQMPFYQAVKLFIHASKLQSVALGNQKTTVPILFILL